MCENRNASSGAERIVCDTSRLALVAMDLRAAWHAGALSAERAMDMLDHASAKCARQMPPSRAPSRDVAEESSTAWQEAGEDHAQ
jgi:hypothetical protein